MTVNLQAQRATIDFLSQLDAYSSLIPDLPAATRIRRIETHGALVFLVGSLAIKLKRAVHFPYMDFSTPDRRRQMCEAELAINRRTAPELYLTVLPVTHNPAGRLALGGDPGDAIDWVLVMRRFPDGALLEEMRRAGRLEPQLMARLADAIATFHKGAEIRTDRGGQAGIRDVVDGNIANLRQYPAVLDAFKTDRYATQSHVWLDRLGGLLDRRAAAGQVRHCHGDLHLNNICLIDGRPILFDAIEFNEPMACTDILYDLAFVLMDLDSHRLAGHANLLLNRYIGFMDEYDGIAAMPLFLSCRAAIRAHVNLAAAALIDDARDQAARQAESCLLLDNALRYLEPPPARLIAIGGLSGTGKSTLAQKLAPHIGAPPGAILLRSDLIRKQLCGVPETTRLSPDAYAPSVTDRVFDIMRQRAKRALAAGYAVIADAVHGDAEQRHAIETVALGQSCPFTGLWLESTPDILNQRVAERRNDASDADTGVLTQQLAHVRPPSTWYRLDAGGDIDHLASTATAMLA